MNHHTVSRSEFAAVARQAPVVSPSRGRERPAPLHIEAVGEAAIVLAATIFVVTLVQCALWEAGIL